MPKFKALILATYSVTLNYLYSVAHRLYTRVLCLIYTLGKRYDPVISPAPQPQGPRFPPELLEHIAEHLFELYYEPNRLDSSNVEEASICCAKPSWQDVEGFMAASPALHHMGIVRWFRVLIIRNKNDWTTAIRYSSLVRFTKLYALSIDSHDDVVYKNNQWAYRRAITSLPSSIVRLEVTHAHCPDANFISAVKRYCPSLEELRLGRCTIFNTASSCDFWRSFPLEHNSYISDGGITEYASSLAQELTPLRHLKILKMGIYLVSSSAVLGHRLYHTRGRLAPETIDWQLAIPLAQQHLDDAAEDPIQVEPANTEALITLLYQSDSEFDGTCNFCVNQYGQANRDAEASANSILVGLVPSLETIQWMNWFTPKHLGVSSHDFMR
ncbi:hypothetical protein FRC12_019321 [Ceratobasidium sp. 428]|nr:hypothetical protein FRC12_019321 [Ceratobasidium sp. 428]